MKRRCGAATTKGCPACGGACGGARYQASLHSASDAAVPPQQRVVLRVARCLWRPFLHSASAKGCPAAGGARRWPGAKNLPAAASRARQESRVRWVWSSEFLLELVLRAWKVCPVLHICGSKLHLGHVVSKGRANPRTSKRAPKGNSNDMERVILGQHREHQEQPPDARRVILGQHREHQEQPPDARRVIPSQQNAQKSH